MEALQSLQAPKEELALLTTTTEVYNQRLKRCDICTKEPAISSHPCNTGKPRIGGSFVYKTPFYGMTEWPPKGGLPYPAHVKVKLLRQFLAPNDKNISIC